MTNTFCQTAITGAATCHVAGAGIELASADVDCTDLYRQLADAGNASTFAELIQRLAAPLDTTAARFIVLCEWARDTDTAGLLQTLLGDYDTQQEPLTSMILGLAQRAIADKSCQLWDKSDGDSLRLLAWAAPGQTEQCLVAGFEHGGAISQTALLTMHAAAWQVASWYTARAAESRENASQRLAALTELLSRLKMASTPKAATRLLANELQEYLGCQQVVVGRCHDGSSLCRLEAISELDAFHPHSEQARVAQAALQESISRGDVSFWPPPDETSRYGLKALERFALSVSTEMVVACPLQDEQGELRGAWLFAGSATDLGRDEVARFVDAARSPVASTLGLLDRAQPGWIGGFVNGLAAMVRQRRGQVALAAVAMVFAVLLVPIPHRVNCDCQLEPVTRRFVAAPFDGPLKESFVEPGDFVTQGQLLARMDGREVRWELAGVQADLYRAAKERAGHVASHEAGAAVVARHEVDRLQYREQLLKSRDQELEIRSPVNGMVVSGDLEEAEGMPLKVGEVLFEVAPLDAMVVELAVPEDDFMYVHSGLPVRISFDAFAFRPYETEIDSVHPRAELRDECNVFIAEVRLDNPQQALHPGMRGHARIDAGKARLGWVLFRRPAAAAIEWLGW